MIQELLGGATFTVGERKTSTNGSGRVLPSPCSFIPSSSPCPSSTTSGTTTTTSSAATTNTPNSAAPSNSENQNLRCPRCDSSNTKFCYYNNYNLTQPRHFCKTCRRYWTKGGALRNVPIGGGCRKNKNVGVSSSAAKTTATKMKTVASELGRSSGLGPGFDHELSSGPMLWGSPQNTHLLALLRASQNQNQNQNPNPNPSPVSLGAVTVKEEGNLMGSQSHMVTDPLLSNVALNPPLCYDSVEQVPSLGLCSSFWRNNQGQPQQTNGGFLLGEHQNSGIQELYQKLRASSANYYCSDNSPVFLGNMASNSSSSISNILESTSVSVGELGYWNPTVSWSDLPTKNGSYP